MVYLAGMNIILQGTAMKKSLFAVPGIVAVLAARIAGARSKRRAGRA
jgi:hypothetical protein